MCGSEMPPPSERQKATGEQHEAWIKQRLQGANQKNDTGNWKSAEVIVIITEDIGKTSARYELLSNTLSRFTGQRDNNQIFLLL